MEHTEEKRDHLRELREHTDRQLKKLKRGILINRAVSVILFVCFLVMVLVLMDSLTPFKKILNGEVPAGELKTYNLQILKPGSTDPSIWMGEMGGGPHVFMYDPDTNDIRLTLGCTHDYPQLNLSDGSGKARIVLHLESGVPELYFTDSQQKKRLGMSVAKDKPALKVNDASDKNRVFLGVLEEDPALILGDVYGKERIGLRLFEEASVLSFKDENGSFNAGIGVKQNGKGFSFP